MATAPMAIPEAEYLGTTYKPDCDYIDGALEERNVGEGLHAYLQLLVGRLLGNHEDDWGVRVTTEWRVRVKPGKYRIPDVCVVTEEQFEAGVLTTPPLLCVEVLSPEDWVPRVLKRMEDFFAMGVHSIWLLDPQTRTGYYLSRFGMHQPEDGVLRVKDSPVHLVLDDLWAAFRVK